MKTLLLPALLALASLSAQADPRISSWSTKESGSYARIYRTLADESAGNAVTTWSRGQGNQNQPTYGGVHRIESSSNWIYLHTTGLAASHVMGPWYLNEAKTQLFPNYPANQAVIYRIPRAPAIPADRTATSLGAIGYFVDGVAQFDAQDGFSYSSSGGQDGSPVNGLRGDGYWNRDAYVNEGVTFDNAMAHQAGSNHHYHVNPPALRHALGDSVDHDISANTYTENFNGQHSPIIGWVADGYPIYGPYGYSNPEDPSSPVRRMISGYQLRTDLASGAVRASYPAWAERFHDVGPALSGSQLGPRIDAGIGGETYSLGRYLEDYDYKGDLDMTPGEDFDLNEQNGRFGVTPEFPGGTWAYFTCVDPDGIPVFPYNIGLQFLGSPTGGTVKAVTEDTTVHFLGGPNMEDRFDTVRHDPDSDEIILTWSTVEGGTYQAESSPDLQAWTEKGAEFTAESTTQSTRDTIREDPDKSYFYRLNRTGITDYDDTGFEASEGGSMSGLAAGTSTTIEVPSARDVTLNTVIIVPEVEASAVVILLEGGDGKITIDETPTGAMIDGNGFLARNAAAFSEEGLVVAVVDVPSDLSAAGIGINYRTGADQATDVEAVVDWVAERTSLPIWVIGMSLGTYSATNSAIRLAGKLDGYALCSASTSPTGEAGALMPTGILELEMEQITVPSIVIGHEDDECAGTPSSGVQNVVDALVNAESVVSNVFGGGKPAASPPCGPLSPHGYYGIDENVIRFIADNIK